MKRQLSFWPWCLYCTYGIIKSHKKFTVDLVDIRGSIFMACFWGRKLCLKFIEFHSMPHTLCKLWETMLVIVVFVFHSFNQVVDMRWGVSCISVCFSVQKRMCLLKRVPISGARRKYRRSHDHGALYERNRKLSTFVDGTQFRCISGTKVWLSTDTNVHSLFRTSASTGWTNCIECWW